MNSRSSDSLQLKSRWFTSVAWFAAGIVATVALTVGVVALFLVLNPAERFVFEAPPHPGPYPPPPLWATLAILLGGWGPAVTFWLAKRRALAAGLAVGATGLTWLAWLS